MGISTRGTERGVGGPERVIHVAIHAGLNAGMHEWNAGHVAARPADASADCSADDSGGWREEANFFSLIGLQQQKPEMISGSVVPLSLYYFGRSLLCSGMG